MTAARSVASSEVDAYWAMVEAHAFRFSRLPEMQNDEDDFIQVGVIAVWDALAKGYRPSNVDVTFAMQHWARTRRRQMHGESPLGDDEASV